MNLDYNDIGSVFEALESTNSRNEKIAILEFIRDNSKDHTTKEMLLSPVKTIDIYKNIFRLAYDPQINFYMSDVPNPDFEHSEGGYTTTLADALTFLEHTIASRAITGNMAKQLVQDNYEMLHPSAAKIFRRIIQRDLKCGISATTINKVFQGLIYQHPYMRCSSFTEKNLSNIQFPCYSQTKMDGLYVDIMVTEDKVEYRSRNGSFLLFNDETVDTHLQQYASDYGDFVLCGEAVAVNESGELMIRQESNGYLNSLDIDTNRIRFFLWDYIKLADFKKGKSTKPYSERIEQLLPIVDLSSRFQIVDTIIAQDKEAIIKHFRENREAGEEGTVVKNFDAIWKSGTSKDQVKIKVVLDVEMKAVAWKYGKGKHENLIGAIVFRSADDEIEVSVGGGYKDAEREGWLDSIQEWVDSGRVATIRSNGITETETGMSLFLPRFVEWRDDKSEADSYERIHEQELASVNALDMIK